MRFIARRRVVTRWDLQMHFGYTYHSAGNRLYRLKLARLIERLDFGEWGITHEGHRKLIYYGYGRELL